MLIYIFELNSDIKMDIIFFIRYGIKIKGVETVWFNPGDHPDWRYRANRRIVENSGRSAAKNCKGYIDTGKRKERVCWMVSKK
jgi:hypothetical protein